MSLRFSDDAVAAKFLEMCEDVSHIKSSQEDTRKRLFGGDGEIGAIPYLHAEVKKHTSQITFWKGGLAVMSFLWAAAIAWGSAVISRHR